MREDEPPRAMIGFQMGFRHIRFLIALPDKTAPEFTRTPGGRRERSTAQAHAAWEQACRQRWRALNLVIKAKLEAVESDISTIEDEFMAWTVLPNGLTVGESFGAEIAQCIEAGEMPQMALPAPVQRGDGDGD